MQDKQSFILNLVCTAVATVPGITEYKTEIALRSGKKLPGFYTTILSNVAQPERNEDLSFKEKDERLVIGVFLEFGIESRDTQGEALLMEEYLRLYQLIEHAVDSLTTEQRAQNDYFIIITGQPACLGGTPLIDRQKMKGSGEMMFEVPFGSVRK